MPGVLITEALAQTGAVAMLNSEENKGKIALFAGIDKCRFKKQVTPGDTLMLEVEITKLKVLLEKVQQKLLLMDNLLVVVNLLLLFKMRN